MTSIKLEIEDFEATETALATYSATDDYEPYTESTPVEGPSRLQPYTIQSKTYVKRGSVIEVTRDELTSDNQVFKRPKRVPSVQIKLVDEVICKYHSLGCNERVTKQLLTQHEADCGYREVNCPALHSSQCTWKGRAQQVWAHRPDANCFEVVKEHEKEGTFRHVIGDHPKFPAVSVTNSIGLLWWKPFMLMSAAVVDLRLYLQVCRYPSGVWYINVRSLLPESQIGDIGVKIEIKSINPAIRERHTYVGGVIAHLTSNIEATLVGKGMTITDTVAHHLKCQIVFFEFHIEVSVSPHSCRTEDRTPMLRHVRTFMCDRNDRHVDTCPEFNIGRADFGHRDYIEPSANTADERAEGDCRISGPNASIDAGT